MNPGELRHQVVIQQRSTTQDAVGNPLDEWTTFATRRASVDRSPGTEVVESAQRQGRVPTLFKLRWLAGVVPAMRVLFDSKIYDVESAVDPTGLKAELHITAMEHVEAVP